MRHSGMIPSVAFQNWDPENNPNHTDKGCSVDVKGNKYKVKAEREREGNTLLNDVQTLELLPLNMAGASGLFSFK